MDYGTLFLVFLAGLVVGVGGCAVWAFKATRP